MPTSAHGNRPAPGAAAPLPLQGAEARGSKPARAGLDWPRSGRLWRPRGLHGTPAAWRHQIRCVRWVRRGFTLIELMVVLAIIAIAAGLVIVALPDRDQDRLNEEAERLGALLEAARTEARASGVVVGWAPAAPQASDGADFRFAGLPKESTLPTRWLSPGVSAEVVGARSVALGPEPVLPPQRIVLRLADRRVVLASDGLAPFAPEAIASP
jgi:general secretion pathway protein H